MIWNYEEYTAKQELPERGYFNNYYIYKEDKCVLKCPFDKLLVEGNKFLIDQGIIEHKCRKVLDLLNKFTYSGYTVETVYDKKTYEELEKAYYAEQSKLHTRYLSKLYKHNGVSKELGDTITSYIVDERDAYCNEEFEYAFGRILHAFGKFLK